MGDDAQAAVVQGPNPVLIMSRPEPFRHLVQPVFRSEACEHGQPVLHAILTFDRRRAIDQPSLLRFLTILFEHSRVLADAGVIPRSLHRSQNFAKGIDD